jgi:ferredoxin--NADP+ reductase
MDVTRILSSSYEELRQTDIADYALEALRHSQVKDIYILGRRGPAQAAFTNPELKELGEMDEADFIVSQEDATPDPLSAAYLKEHPDSLVEKNLLTLQEYARRPLSGKPRRIHMKFLASPVELTGKVCVETLKIVKNELYIADDGSLRPRPTEQYELLPVGLVFRSVGYQGVPLPDVSFDTSRAVIPNETGRVIDLQTNKPLPGEYVVGWIKRGPNGIIGTNKPDSVETAENMLEDIPTLAPLDPSLASCEAMEALIRERKPDYVSYTDWQIIDRLEIENGQAVSRPRVKFSTIAEMLNALKLAKNTAITR